MRADARKPARKGLIGVEVAASRSDRSHRRIDRLEGLIGIEIAGRFRDVRRRDRRPVTSGTYRSHSMGSGITVEPTTRKSPSLVAKIVPILGLMYTIAWISPGTASGVDCRRLIE